MNPKCLLEVLLGSREWVGGGSYSYSTTRIAACAFMLMAVVISKGSMAEAWLKFSWILNVS